MISLIREMWHDGKCLQIPLPEFLMKLKKISLMNNKKKFNVKLILEILKKGFATREREGERKVKVILKKKTRNSFALSMNEIQQ